MNVAAQPTWFGDRAVLVACDGHRQRELLARLLTDEFPDQLVRSGMRSVMVEATVPSPRLLEQVTEALGKGLRKVSIVDRVARSIEVVVEYDGPDLEPAASALGVGITALVELHAKQAWRVAMMGFAPGFGYLVPEGDWCVDWSLLARRGDPRPEVPQGSVAIAAGMSAIYPARMPGGWHLIGRTDMVLFDVDRREPALLAADDIVRFRIAAP